MNKFKQFILGFLIGGMLFSTTALYADNILKDIKVQFMNIKISVNDKIVTSNKEPFIYNDSTYVPIRLVAESLNKEVGWNNATKTVTIKDKETSMLKKYVEDGLNITEIDGVKYIDTLSIYNRYSPFGYLFRTKLTGVNELVYQDPTTKEITVLLDYIEGERNNFKLDNKEYIKYDKFMKEVKPLIKISN